MNNKTQFTFALDNVQVDLLQRTHRHLLHIFSEQELHQNLRHVAASSKASILGYVLLFSNNGGK